MQIRVAAPLTFDSIVDGPGIRIVIWTQGCPHHCPSCHNPQTHDFNGGYLTDIDEMVNQIVDYKLKSGITLSGGEPFVQPEALLELVKKLKANKINIWAFTGFLYEDLLENIHTKTILEYIDVLVDGPFKKDLMSFGLKFKGSSNQRTIDVPKSLVEKKVVLLENF